MKLLICTSEYYPCGSGIANVVYNVVKHLEKMGFDCTICSPIGPDIKLGNPKMIENFGIIGLVYYWLQVSKYFKKNDFEYVWLHNPLFLKNSPFKKSTVTVHSTNYGKVLRGMNPKIYHKIATKIQIYSLKNSNKKARFTAVSKQVCKELNEMGISKDRMIYIPNGVDVDLFKPSDGKRMLRKNFGIPEDDLIILSLGRLSNAKQPHKLIEIFSSIEKEIENVTLVIAGNGELLETTKNLSKKNKLKNIIFLGHVDHKIEAPDVYACSEYYMMTSKYEGQPLTLLEAMSSGLSCIVSDIPSLKIVEDADCGIVVDFKNVDRAAEKIIDYLKRDNPDHFKNSRSYAINNLDWKIIAKKYLEEIIA